MRHTRFPSSRLLLASLCLLFSASLFAAAKPNVIIIMTDDQGYGDVGFNGSTELKTPHLDRFAYDGVRFPAGYVTHPYCSPSRAALMAGRMQQRFGHEHNPQHSFKDHSQGIPQSEVLLPARLKTAGYATSLIGKWHLGHAEPFHPLNRGFDEFFGMLGGGFSYYGTPKADGETIMRGHDSVPAEAITYLTDDFTAAAVDFIQRHRQNPFFLYLAYNAPHAPDHATPKYLERFPLLTGKRKIYAAMVSAVDDGVGRVMAELKTQGIDNHTLVFFLSDNGGRSGVANNGPLRGLKGRTYEGGVRVPFAARWPGHLPSGIEYPHPVSSLDIHATALALAGVADQFADRTEGVNLMPFVDGTNPNSPHDILHWRVGGGWDFALREGNYKLAKPGFSPHSELYDLSTDIGEQHDLADELPDVKNRLIEKHIEWDAANVPPLWLDPHVENIRQENAGGVM
jgi:arylsulfatase A-like enzyme